MKVKTNDIPLEMGGVKVEGEFRIRNSAKAFSILSSGLYANKVEAILRELGCNAYDSHVEAGKADVPFTVHLPTTLNPQFYVRDYGIGLDHDGVTKLYTTYFESTKQDSNDYVGCLGLGSKSPFSYTRNFTVTAIKDGMERIYNCFINEQGIPSVALLNEMETEKGNGVEVRFAVNNRSDMNEFASTAQRVYRWFKVKPEVIGNAITIPEIKYKERDIAPGVHILAENYGDRYYRHSFAMMGNVVYPIKMPTQDAIPNSMRNLLDRGNYLMEFAIGELDVAASREELSYDDATVRALVAKTQLLLDKAAEFLEKQVTNEKTDWEKACKLVSVVSSDHTLFGSAMETFLKKATPTLRGMFKDDGYSHNLRLVLDDKSYDRVTVSATKLVADIAYNSSAVRLHKHTPYRDYTSQSEQHQVEPNITFIVQNDRGNLLGRIRQAVEDRSHGLKNGSSIFVVRRGRKEGDTLKVWDTISKKLGNPPVIFSDKLPQLQKAVKTKHGEVKAYSFERTSGNSRYAPDVYRFRPGPKKLKDFKRVDGKIVYLPLHGKQARWGDKVMSASDLLMKLVDKDDGVLTIINHAQLEKVEPDTIYGVNGTSLKTAEDSSDWISLFDLVTERLNTLDWSALEKDVENAAKAAALDSDSICLGTKHRSTHPLMSYEHPSSPFGELARQARELTGTKTVLEQLMRLQRATRLLPDRKGKVDELEARRAAAAAEMTDLLHKVKESYPLLRHLDSYSHNEIEKTKAVRGYIESLDKLNH